MDSEKVERLRDRLLMCPICMDEYKDPRLLPCHHTVCLECIESYLQASSITGRMFRCPQCRRDVPVPRGGIRDFPLNFYIISLQDELGTKTYTDTCDMCQKDWLTSQFRCVDCDMVICKFCIHEHRLFQHEASRHYNIMRIEINPADALVASTKMCSQHPQDVLQLYCSSCDKPVCITCMYHSHKNHDTVPLGTKLTSARTFLQEELDNLQQENQCVRRTLNQVQESTLDMSKSADQARQDVVDRGKVLHDKVDRLMQMHIRQIGEGETKVLHELGAYEKDLRVYADEIEKGLRFLEDLQEGDMCLELLDCYYKYHKVLQEQKTKTVNKTIETKKYIFHSGWDTDFQQYYMGSVGRLECHLTCQKFLSRKRLFDGYRGKDILQKLLTPGKLALLLVGMFMLYTIGRLIHMYVTSPVQAEETSLVLVFCVYLFLASIFAYRKS